MKRFLFLTLLLLLPATVASTPTGKGGLVNLPGGHTIAFSWIDDGQGMETWVWSRPGGETILGHYPTGTAAASATPIDIGGLVVGTGSTVSSSWTSDGVKRTVTTAITGAGESYHRLALQRHDKLVKLAQTYWPRDP